MSISLAEAIEKRILLTTSISVSEEVDNFISSIPEGDVGDIIFPASYSSKDRKSCIKSLKDIILNHRTELLKELEALNNSEVSFGKAKSRTKPAAKKGGARNSKKST